MDISYRVFDSIDYNDEPKPEYAPQKNKESIVIAAKPPTKPTSHKGILPVFAIKKAPISGAFSFSINSVLNIL